EGRNRIGDRTHRNRSPQYHGPDGRTGRRIGSGAELFHEIQDERADGGLGAEARGSCRQRRQSSVALGRGENCGAGEAGNSSGFVFIGAEEEKFVVNHRSTEGAANAIVVKPRISRKAASLDASLG